MKVIFRLILLAALAAVALWLWSALFPNPEKVVRQHLQKLAQLASFQPGEGNIAKLAKVERLGNLFSTHVQINISSPGLHDQAFDTRAELVQAALAARANVASVSAEFLDIAVTLDPDRRNAVANVNLRAQVSGETAPIYEPLKFIFLNTNDEWLITRVESVKALQ